MEFCSVVVVVIVVVVVVVVSDVVVSDVDDGVKSRFSSSRVVVGSL